jgi:hypothetical protein
VNTKRVQIEHIVLQRRQATASRSLEGACGLSSYAGA